MKAGERDEFLRAAWRVLVAGGSDARDLVFVDECGAHTSLAPSYGYSPRGERVYPDVPRNRGPNTTLLSAGTKYKAVVTTGAKDLAGNRLDQNTTLTGNQQKSWTFTTKG